VRVFSTTHNSASIASFVSKWLHFSFIFNWENSGQSQGKFSEYSEWRMRVMLFFF
jgi:hypothetical protein